MKSIHRVCFLLGVVALLPGCASTYGNLVSGSKLGAQEYMPAVLVKPGKDADYQQVLGICRSAAVNRQVTSAQEAQLKTITGVAGGALTGASKGWEIGALFKDAGLGNSINKSIGAGLGAGLIGSIGSAFSSGTTSSADATKAVLLTCLRQADPISALYTVLE
jgi:hypothetical protein